MNKARRKELEKISSGLTDLQERLQEVLSEEEDAYDNLPEGIQDGERGDEMQEYISKMEEADYSLTEAIDNIDEIWNC